MLVIRPFVIVYNEDKFISLSRIKGTTNFQSGALTPAKISWRSSCTNDRYPIIQKLRFGGAAKITEIVVSTQLQ